MLYFFVIHYDVYYHLAKFERTMTLIHGKTKIHIVLWGKIGQMA